MKKHWIEYQDTPPNCPMTYWVHRAVSGENATGDRRPLPPRQSVVPAMGYPVFHIEFDGFTFEFASLEEIRVCAETFQSRLLPRTLDLSRDSGAGPNSHWLSRLPSHVKPWKYRERAAAYFLDALKAFKREISSST